MRVLVVLHVDPAELWCVCSCTVHCGFKAAQTECVCVCEREDDSIEYNTIQENRNRIRAG